MSLLCLQKLILLGRFNYFGRQKQSMEVECTKCKGTGKAKCQRCTDGYNYSVDSECLFCDEGEIKCPMCNGKGKIES
ncbi:MAG: hypothetical protein KGH53_01825 [Candidatus Micrarchaeota archaeon]|nr:hypothetical protein [Candidatus Micrarchaeota archaeon]